MNQEGNAPFTARSVLASALLGTDPPELPVAQLIRLCALLGINENRARVALSRMVASGEASTDGAGRYRLAGHLLARQHRQAASRAGSTRRWEGDWHLVVVTMAGSTAEVRSKRRAALRFVRLGELREGTWLRPNNLELAPLEGFEADVVHFTARPEAPEELASTLWPLAQWEQTARSLLSKLESLEANTPDMLAPGFELSAAVLRHLQADPLLPLELLPSSWPGETLRRRYDGWDRRYRELLARWSRSSRDD
jgi:phenylacetic acid degradation operon negative regulatory protein